MKLAPLFAAFLLTAAQLHAEVMVVCLSDGTQERVPVTDVRKISFSTGTVKIVDRQCNNALHTGLHVGACGQYVTLTLEQKSSVRIDIYNAYGQIVKNIRLAEKLPGTYKISLNSGIPGKGLARGCYFARAVMGNKIITKNFLMLK